MEVRRNNNDGENSIDLECTEQQQYIMETSSNRVQFVEEGGNQNNQSNKQVLLERLDTDPLQAFNFPHVDDDNPDDDD